MYVILLSVSVASRATESRRDKEEVGDSSWTLTAKRLDAFAGPGEIKRREVVLDPQEVSPEETMSIGGGVGLRKLDFLCISCFTTVAELRTLSLSVALFRKQLEQ